MILLKTIKTWRAASKAGADDLAALVGDFGGDFRFPQSSCLGVFAARAIDGIGQKRIDDFPVVPDAEMHVREIGFARIADVAKAIALRHRLTFRDADRALLQMAVLRFPAVAVVEQNAVAAFAALDAPDHFVVAHEDVGNAVTAAFDDAIGGRQDGHSGRC